MNELSAGTLVLIYLSAMILTAPIAKKAGLGAVLGYLLAGAVLGPHALGVVQSDSHEVMHLAEFGVIMMLFLIGLELKPALLWKLRWPIFGMGGMQVGLSILAILLITLFSGQTWQIGLVIGMILSLSSTAIVLQTLQEKNLLKTTGGDASFSILLFQDIAVIPILAIFPMLAGTASATQSGPPGIEALKILGAVALVGGVGKFLVSPIFGLIARAELRELFTALALLLVLATSTLMSYVGLSPALGAFLAGVVLAESQYRHQLEADIQPFKGLLLAIFFISVGAGIDFGMIRANLFLTLACVFGLIITKGLVLVVTARLTRMSWPDSAFLAFALAQGGEFAFVLINYATGQQLLDTETGKLVTASVALSMALAPILIAVYIRWIEPVFASDQEVKKPDEINEHNPVLVAGFGRFGQMIGRFLRSCGIQATVLDYDSEQVNTLRKFGAKAFFGDASRMDLLVAAGAREAKLLILAIDDREKTTEIVEQVRREFPHLKILARVYDRIHAYELIHRGIKDVYIETSGSALNMGMDALKFLGFRSSQALRFAQNFKRHNDRSIVELAKSYHEADETAYINQARGWLEALEQTMRADVQKARPEVDRGWESPPRSSPLEPVP